LKVFSSLAPGSCYQLSASKLAVELKDNVQLNLAQLHNSKLQVSKSDGRNHPGTADVDDVAAPDADPAVASSIMGILDIDDLACSDATLPHATY